MSIPWYLASDIRAHLGGWGSQFLSKKCFMENVKSTVASQLEIFKIEVAILQ